MVMVNFPKVFPLALLQLDFTCLEQFLQPVSLFGSPVTKTVSSVYGEKWGRKLFSFVFKTPVKPLYNVSTSSNPVQVSFVSHLLGLDMNGNEWYPLHLPSKTCWHCVYLRSHNQYYSVRFTSQNSVLTVAHYLLSLSLSHCLFSFHNSQHPSPNLKTLVVPKRSVY